MAFDQIFNLVEGLVWLAIAAVLLARVRRVPQHRDILRVAAVAFILFGITDFIEIRTRAWYSPPWLLAWNAACVTTLFGCLLAYVRRRRKLEQRDRERG